MIAVFTIADRTDGQDDADLWVMLAENVDGLLQVVSTRINSEFLFLKEGSRALLTVVDNLACFLQAVDMVGAEGEENRAGITAIPLYTLQGMEDGGWIVHCPKGIDDDGEALVLEMLTDAVSETRAHEKQGFAGCNPKVWGGDVDNGSKIHDDDISLFRYFDDFDD